MEIYQINHIKFNTTYTTFSLAFDKGVNIYSINPFSLKSFTNDIGKISLSCPFYESSLILLVGSNENPNYNKKSLVLYESQELKRQMLWKEELQSDILFINVFKNFVVVQSIVEVFIYNIVKSSKLNKITSISLYTNIDFELPLFEFKLNSISNLSQSMVDQNFVNILIYKSRGTIQINEISQLSKNSIEAVKVIKEGSLPYSNIQKYVYVESVRKLYVVSSKGDKIREMDLESMKKEREFFRGASPARITDLILIKDKYLCVSSGNNTVHVFSLEKKHNHQNISSMITGFFASKGEDNFYHSFIKINLHEITLNDTLGYFRDNFNKKGCLLYHYKDKDMIEIICYNGYSYQVTLNFNENKYKYNNKKCAIVFINNCEINREKYGKQMNNNESDEDDDDNEDNKLDLDCDDDEEMEKDTTKKGFIVTNFLK